MLPLSTPFTGEAIARVNGLVVRASPTPATKDWAAHALRLARTLFVGAWASLLDFGVLVACMRWLMLTPVAARLVALVISGAALFFGNRLFAFRARAGSLSRQTKLFVIAEVIALPLNLLAFRLLVSNVSFVGPALLSQVANFLVFVAFAYPVRHFIVFRVPLATAPAR